METNIVFFIGAGFTKAIAETAPTGAEFLTKAFNENGPFSSDKKIQHIKSFVEENYYPLNNDIIPSIEDLLSLIDYTIQRNEALSSNYLLDDVIRIRNELIYLIGKVIKDSLENNNRDKLLISREFIRKILEFRNKNNEVTIISTNYDIILDNSLIDVCKSCNYGALLRHCIHWNHNIEEINEVNGHKTWGGGNIVINKGDIPLLKIHGSLNWFYCPKCDEIDLTVKNKGATILADTQSKFICDNKFCTSFYKPLLVTPTMLKVYNNSFLKKIWDMSDSAISKADRLVFIGYSLPEADYHIRSLISKSLIKNANIDEILVIEKKPKKENHQELKWQENVKRRYNSLFGPNLINFQPIGLEDFINKWDDFIG